jgi:hypothetical protein
MWKAPGSGFLNRVHTEPGDGLPPRPAVHASLTMPWDHQVVATHPRPGPSLPATEPGRCFLWERTPPVLGPPPKPGSAPPPASPDRSVISELNRDNRGDPGFCALPGKVDAYRRWRFRVLELATGP